MKAKIPYCIVSELIIKKGHESNEQSLFKIINISVAHCTF